MAKSVTVKLAMLSEPLKVSRIKAGTKLADFLENHDIEYDSSVRVNGATSSKGHALKNGDIITVVGEVSGG